MLELIGVDELTQWDVGRQVKVDKDVDMVHFSNRPYGYSKNVKVMDGVANVPDMFLTSCAPLRVWAYVGDFEKGYTKIEKIYEIKPKNRPEDYIYTPEEVKTWEKLQSEIGDLANLETEAKENLVAAINEVAADMSGGVALDTTLTQSGQAADAKAVGDALAKKQPKGDYLTQDNLQSATDAALEQAKASGEFDGADGAPGKDGADGYSPTANVTQNNNGATITITDKNGTTTATVTNGKNGADGNPGANGSPGAPGADGKSAYQYAQDGGYTGTENEFAEKLAQEKFVNPNALTFTGAVTGSYDGSEALTVNIPAGGGGGGSSDKWELINTITVSDDATTNVTFTQDSAGNPFALKKLYLKISSIKGGSTYPAIRLNGLNWKQQFGGAVTGAAANMTISVLFELLGNGIYIWEWANPHYRDIRRTGEIITGGATQSLIETINSVMWLWGGGSAITNGSVFTLYGVRA